jgi:hypothetical protein
MVMWTYGDDRVVLFAQSGFGHWNNDVPSGITKETVNAPKRAFLVNRAKACDQQPTKDQSSGKSLGAAQRRQYSIITMIVFADGRSASQDLPWSIPGLYSNAGRPFRPYIKDIVI